YCARRSETALPWRTSCARDCATARAPDYFKGFFGRMHTLDTGRGCPFTCSFCTIINVQGHDPRYRSVAAIVNRVRRAMECGGRGRPSHDGRIPSTQTLREPATVGTTDLADGTHSPRDLAGGPVCRPRLPGILHLATGLLRKLLRRARWRRRSLGR